jgi:hypothetical protein
MATKEEQMSTFFAVLMFLFVVVVLVFLAIPFFEATPLAHHRDQYRDPRTGKRIGQSPRLD